MTVRPGEGLIVARLIEIGEAGMQGALFVSGYGPVSTGVAAAEDVEVMQISLGTAPALLGVAANQ